MTSQDFNRNPTSVKRKADQGPVFITEHGNPAYVVINIDEYRNLQGTPKESLVTFLRSEEFDDYEFPEVDIDFPGAPF